MGFFDTIVKRSRIRRDFRDGQKSIARKSEKLQEIPKNCKEFRKIATKVLKIARISKNLHPFFASPFSVCEKKHFKARNTFSFQRYVYTGTVLYLFYTSPYTLHGI